MGAPPPPVGDVSQPPKEPSQPTRGLATKAESLPSSRGSITGVSKSTDRGETWNTASVGLPRSENRALAIDPLTPTTLYAGTFKGVFKSTDGGATWSAANIGLEFLHVFDLAIDPSLPTTVFTIAQDDAAEIAGEVGVFKSTDSGTTWNPLDTGPMIFSFSDLAIDPVTPTTIYVTTNAGVIKSTDGGDSWEMSEGLENSFVNNLAIDPLNPTTVYTATTTDIFKSTDGGVTWSAASEGLPRETGKSVCCSASSLIRRHPPQSMLEQRVASSKVPTRERRGISQGQQAVSTRWPSIR